MIKTKLAATRCVVDLARFRSCRRAAGKVFDSRDIEYKYLGPHPDMRKTKELQDQGKKINLSLSEVSLKEARGRGS